MNHISVKGEQSTDEATALLASLDSLAVTPTGYAITKTGLTTVANTLLFSSTTLSGDVTGSGTTSIATTVTKINGVAYSADPLVQYIALSPATSARNVIAPTADRIGLTVRPYSTQTADIWRVENNAGTLQHLYTDANGDTHIGKQASFTSGGQTYANSYKLYFDNLGNGSNRTAYIQATPYAAGSNSEVKVSFYANGVEQFFIGQPGGTVVFNNGAQIGTILGNGDQFRGVNGGKVRLRGEFNQVELQGEKNTAGDYDVKVIGKNAFGTTTVSNIVGFYNDSTVVAKIDPNGVVSGRIGTSTTFAKHGGAISDHFVDVGNGTTIETDLYSDTLPANALNTNGDKVEAEYGGVFVSSATATREIKIYFGGTAIFDTGALTLSLSSAWTAYVSIIRVSATVIRYMVSFATEGAALSAYTAVGELTGLTLSNANILKITGQAAGVGAATNDIVAKMGHVEWLPAA